MTRTRDPRAESRILVLPVQPLDRRDALAFIDRLRTSHASDRVQESRDDNAVASDASSGAEPPRALALEASDDLPWTISNKYYEADVHFHIGGGQGGAEDGDGTGIDLANGTEPAVVVLVRADSPPTSTSLASFLSQLSERASAPEVCVLVTLATSKDAAAGQDEGDQADLWQDLALAHEFEWIHVPSSKVDASSASSSVYEEDGEEGVAAVIAALHAHVWPNMRMVEQRAPRRRARRASTADDAEPLQVSLASDEPRTDLEEPYMLSKGSSRPAATFSDPTDWSFPPTFLPSVPRASESSSSVGAAVDRTSAAQPTDSAFEDDFAPFVSAPARGDSATSTSTTAFPTGATSIGGHLAAEDDEDNLADLFERVSLARSQAQGMDLAARRDFAARMVEELLGVDMEGLSDPDE